MKQSTYKPLVIKAALGMVLALFLSCKSLNLKGTGALGRGIQMAKGAVQVVKGVSTAFDDLTIKDEITIGRAVSAKILSRNELHDTKLHKRYVNLVGKLVASYRPRRKKEDGPPRLDFFYFGILDTEKLNAYSTPGGYVFVSKGLLNLCRDESELAGVLAHEVAHVEREHILKAIKTKREQKGFTQAVSGAASLGTAVADMGDGSQAAQEFLSGAAGVASNVIFQDGFSKEQEVESDQLAAKLAVSAGYDPYGLVRILKRIRKETGDQSSKTHPATEKRIQKIKSFIEENDFPTEGARLESRYFESLTS